MMLSSKGITKALIRLPESAVWSVPLLFKFANPKDIFSLAEAHVYASTQEHLILLHVHNKSAEAPASVV